MLKIGDFSKLANVTVKTLRHYAELGLLRPAWIDRFTGYRYYALEQLPRLNRILALKDLGLTLEQIQRVLDEDLSADELRGMLHLKQAELRQRVQEEQMRLARVEARLQQIQQEGRIAIEAVALRAVDSQLVVYHPLIVPTLERLPERRAQAQRDIEAWLARAGGVPRGPWMLIYTSGEYLERNIPVEVAIGIEGIPRGLQAVNGHIPLRALPALPQAAVYAHTGSPEGLPEAYTTLYRWVEANGFRVSGLAREVYWTDADPNSAQRQSQERLLWDEDSLPRPRVPAPGEESSANIIEVILPVEPVTFPKNLKESTMEPEMIEHGAILVAGTLYEGDNANQEIAQMWASEFDPNVDKIKRKDGYVFYGVCEMDASLPQGSFRYVAAAEIEKPEDAPPEFYQMCIPAGKYADFKHIGSLDTLRDTYHYIYEVWLPKSGYKRANRPDLEVYTEEFHDFQPDSVLHLWIPVE